MTAIDVHAHMIVAEVLRDGGPDDDRWERSLYRRRDWPPVSSRR